MRTRQALAPFSTLAVLSVASALIAIAVFGLTSEILAGLLGPLAATTISLMLTEQTFRRHPERVTALMVKGFAAKFVFFGAYVWVVLTVLALRPLPFVVSFTSYFVILYLVEAVCLSRLFALEK